MVVVLALTRKEIQQTAKAADDPACCSDRIERFRQIGLQISRAYANVAYRFVKAKVLERFVRKLESGTLVLAIFTVHGS